LVDKISQCGASHLNRFSKNLANGKDEIVIPRRGDSSRPHRRSNTCTKQGFVGVYIADSNNDPPVHDKVLHRQSASAGLFLKIGAGESLCEGFNSELCQQPVSLRRPFMPVQAAKPPRVIEPQ